MFNYLPWFGLVWFGLCSVDIFFDFKHFKRQMIQLRFMLMSIFPGQVDLWTRKPSGCPCEWENNAYSSNSGVTNASHIDANAVNASSHSPHHAPASTNCACCVKGGCQCGSSQPARCGQCGLEQYCINSECH